MGRPRRLYSEQEEEERKERRRAQQLEWQRNKRRQGAIASSSSASSISESLAKENIARLERRRERNRLYERRRRANKTDEDRAREAQRKWEARRRRNATPAEQFPGVTPRFRREFVENLSGLTWNRGHFGPDEFQIAPRMTGRKEEKSANGWGGSRDESTISANAIKTEPPEYVEQDEEPSCHLVSVKSGEPPDPMDVTKVTFHTNPGLGAAAPKEFRQDAVPVNPIGSYSVLARPPQWVFPANSDKAQPQVKVIYFRKVEQGIAMQPVMTTLPVAAGAVSPGGQVPTAGRHARVASWFRIGHTHLTHGYLLRGEDAPTSHVPSSCITCASLQHMHRCYTLIAQTRRHYTCGSCRKLFTGSTSSSLLRCFGEFGVQFGSRYGKSHVRRGGGRSGSLRRKAAAVAR
ncbi:hypothetical protein HPB47_007944 [Ixodes persulcatus]|uniref:Uncharacterized protein n=1 Tax=Ixodes persulcatus TaxID=34615 RepID=A0AC60P6H3_IXOPE|nr:hypothetical protein HPB47_007944 [Ixodes persulcatus]